MLSRRAPRASSATYSDTMLVAIACDASPDIGTGHVTRCLAVAEELSCRGHDPVFVGEIDGPQWLRAMLAAFRSAPADQVLALADVTLLDSYQPDRRDTLLLSGMTGDLVVVVDDLTPRFPADAYVEPCVTLSWAPPRESVGSPRLAGPDAVLIRRAMRRSAKERPVHGDPQPPHVLVTLGGTVGPDAVTTAIRALDQLSVEMDVSYIFPEELPVSARWVPSGNQLRRELRAADVVICAGGVTSWEAAHHGRAIGLLCLVDNQASNYEFMRMAGMALNLGRLDLGEPVDGYSLERLLRDSRLRETLGSASWEQVDGRGPERAVDLIESICS